MKSTHNSLEVPVLASSLTALLLRFLKLCVQWLCSRGRETVSELQELFFWEHGTGAYTKEGSHKSHLTCSKSQLWFLEGERLPGWICSCGDAMLRVESHSSAWSVISCHRLYGEWVHFCGAWTGSMSLVGLDVVPLEDIFDPSGKFSSKRRLFQKKIIK